jgi:hypothetical protein
MNSNRAIAFAAHEQLKSAAATALAANFVSPREAFVERMR